MLRVALDKRLICVTMFPFNFWSDVNSNVEKPKELSKTRIMLDRITDAMFTKAGSPTKELQSVINTTTISTVIGFIMGAKAKAKDASIIYKAENQAKLYRHPFLAYRDAQYHITMAFIKGGYPVALKLGTLCFLFSSIGTGLFVYRAKFDVFNNICAGAVSGFLYKLNMGLKGALAGGLLGTILGTMYGIVTSILLFVTNTDMNDLYASGSDLMMERQRLRRSIRR